MPMQVLRSLSFGSFRPLVFVPFFNKWRMRCALAISPFGLLIRLEVQTIPKLDLTGSVSHGDAGFLGMKLKTRKFGSALVSVFDQRARARATVSQRK